MNRLKLFSRVAAGLGWLFMTVAHADHCPAPSQLVSSQGQWKTVPGWIITQNMGQPRGGAELQTVWIGDIIGIGAASFARPEGNFGVTCSYAGTVTAASLNLVKFGNVKPSGKWTVFSGRNVYCSTSGSNVALCSWK